MSIVSAWKDQKIKVIIKTKVMKLVMKFERLSIACLAGFDRGVALEVYFSYYISSLPFYSPINCECRQELSFKY